MNVDDHLDLLHPSERAFLLHASSISKIPIIYDNPFLEISNELRWVFYIAPNADSMEFSCFTDRNTHPSDLISPSPSPSTQRDKQECLRQSIELWRSEFQSAVDRGRITDFRTITLLTAILNYQP